MRITLDLDEEVIDLVRRYSQTRALTLGRAASELLRKGASRRTPTRIVNGLVVFDIARHEPRITIERVKGLGG